MSFQPETLLTPEEYLAIERKSEIKYHLRRLVMMACLEADEPSIFWYARSQIIW